MANSSSRLGVTAAKPAGVAWVMVAVVTRPNRLPFCLAILPIGVRVVPSGSQLMQPLWTRRPLAQAEEAAAESVTRLSSEAVCTKPQTHLRSRRRWFHTVPRLVFIRRNTSASPSTPMLIPSLTMKITFLAFEGSGVAAVAWFFPKELGAVKNGSVVAATRLDLRKSRLLTPPLSGSCDGDSAVGGVCIKSESELRFSAVLDVFE